MQQIHRGWAWLGVAIFVAIGSATLNWATIPAHVEQLRASWEWSHAAGAVLNVAAVSLLVLALLPPELERRRHFDP